MIVDLDMSGKLVLVAGGGPVAERRVRALLDEGCRIIVASPSLTPALRAHARSKKISHKKGSLAGPGLVSRYRPDMVIAATSDPCLNAQILSKASSVPGCLAYSADDPEGSDFANLAHFDVKKAVRVAVSTHGQSPAMAKAISSKVRRAASDAVTAQDAAHIRVQHMARQQARSCISGPAERRQYLLAVSRDRAVRELIRQGRLSAASMRAKEMLGEWGRAR